MEQKKIKLAELCSNVEQEMRELGFREDTIYRYQSVWKKLIAYAGNIDYSPKICADFLAKNYKINNLDDKGKFSKTQMYHLRSVRVLADYFNFGTFFRRKNIRPIIQWPESFAYPVQSYIAHLTVSGKSENYIYRVKNTIKELLLYLDKASVCSIEAVKAEHVSGYILSLVGYAPKTIATNISILKCFFRYLYMNEIIAFPLAETLPKVQQCVRTILPTIWSKEEIEKIIGVVDRGNPTGKRDYAMLLLVARLGLRIGDLVGLQMPDINWHTNQITITQNKTNDTLSLPLLDDVGWAIIDYLKHGRPTTQSKHVFVRHLPPFQEFSRYNNLHNMLIKYIVRAGIPAEGKSKIGMHSLRHSLASELMQNNVEITTISQILGHSNVETTRHYLQVNLPALRQCALNVEVAKNEI